MSKDEPRSASASYPLPELQKSPLNPYKYRCLLMKNKIRLLVISIDDHPENFEGQKVGKNGELELVTEFNKKYCTDPENRKPHELATGEDIFRDYVKSSKADECKSTERKTKKAKTKKTKKEQDDAFIGAMALVVGVGDISDPGKLFGLAHLTEHCVFLGSKKYPKPSELFEFTRTRDGVANASTSFFNTDYFMSAKSIDVYKEALDRFSDMLCDPIMDDARVKNEVNAVDCEFAMRQRRASIGLLQILRSFTHPDNPMHRFSCGNRTTLNAPKLGEVMRDWKKRYYVGNVMTVTLVATLSLDELEDLAVHYFSKIDEGTHIPQQPPWSVVKTANRACSPHFHNLFKVFTQKYARDLLINFSMPPEYWKRIGVRPFRFLSFILMDRGPNGLRTYLNRKGYSVDFYAGPLEHGMCLNEFNSLFSILVVMSPKGLENYEEILEIVFAYIRMLQQNKPPVWFYEEMQTFHQQKFHYAYQTNHIYARRAMARAVKNSHLMQGVPTWRILSTQRLMAHYDEELINNVLNALVPTKANIIVTSQCFRSIATISEPYYKYSYSQEKVPETLMKRMSTSDLKFQLPLGNPYLNLVIGRVCHGTNKYVRPEPSTDVGGKATILCLEVEEPQVGLLAKVKTAMFIKSEVMDRWEPSQLDIIVDLMAYLFELEINSKHKPASGSLVKVTTGTRGGNLAIFMHCPAQFFVPIFEDIFKMLYQFEKSFNEDCFEAKKHRIVEALLDKWMDDAGYGEQITNYIFSGDFVHYPFLKYRLAELKWSTFVRKVEEFRQRFFVTIAIEGCIEDCQVDELRRVISGWASEPPALGTIPMYSCISNRTVILEKGERVFRIQSKLDISEVTFVKDHYQFDRSVSQEMVQRFTFLMSLAAFYQLRTEQHLAYHVKALPHAIGGVPMIVIEVLPRAYIYTAGYVNEQIKVFVRKFYEKNVQTQKGFSAMIKNRGPEHSSLDWRTIKTIFEDFLLPTGSKYRNLCVQICGSYKDSKSKPRDASNPHQRMGTEVLKTYSAALGSVPHIVTKSKKKEKEKYYILNIDKYRTSLDRFVVDKSCDDEVFSPFENAEGETSEEE